MIDKDFNFGWGEEHHLRQLEQQIIFEYLDSWVKDNKHNIVVNSTWYGMDHHQVVKQYMDNHPVDRVACVCFMDPAIVHEGWFENYNVEVRKIGYYRSVDEIDAWALYHDRYFRKPVVIGGAEGIDTPFLCYNRKPHWHRKRFWSQLHERDLIDRGVVSMGWGSAAGRSPVFSSKQRRAIRAFEPDNPVQAFMAPNMDPEMTGIVNDIFSLGAMKIWNQCLLNVVTETVYDVEKDWFVSEKIYKPIMGLRPFIVHAPNGAANWLTHIGLEHFLDDFKDITDLELRDPMLHAEFLQQLSSQSVSYLQHKYQQLLDKIRFNHSEFYQHIARTKQKVQTGIQQ